MSKSVKSGFTLLEVMVVVIIIGILSALGWASMNELIQTNKAKEAARTLTAFAERAIAESKMRKEDIYIKINGNTIEARLKNATGDQLFSQPLANGFSSNLNGNSPPVATLYNGGVTSQVRIGVSGIPGPGCFAVCNASNYCGSAVKATDINTFTAHIKKKGSDTWEAL